MLKTSKPNAAVDIANALKAVFKKYSFSSRKSAWEAINKGKGKKEIENLLIHPDKPTNSFHKLSFTEWLQTRN